MLTRDRILVAAVLLIGLAAGLGIFTFGYARGWSYLTSDPAACANCHIMSEHYAAWMKASHHAVAGCNDCHTPHDPIGKYATKARNGFWHSFYFTLGGFPDPLRITEANRRITEAACRDCHAPFVVAMRPDQERGDEGTAPANVPRQVIAAHAGEQGEPVSCVRCHRYVGHLVR